jgi:integrase
MSIDRRTTKSGAVYDVRLRAPDGRPYKRTFRTKREAETFQAQQRADRSRGGWVDPRACSISFSEYAASWTANRVNLRPRTRELYESLLRVHLLPRLGPVDLGDLTTSVVRTWHAGLIAAGRPGPTTVAKCYRLLRTMLATAVEDGILVKNPCVIRSAGVERSDERTVATVPQVVALADAIDPRYRAMVLLATFCGLRFGELAGLTRDRLDLLHRRVTVTEQMQELSNGDRAAAPPKTAAGRRVVALPPHLFGELEAHLSTHAEPGADGLVFPAPEGGPLRRGNFRQRMWVPACKDVGIARFRFHDLRHTGNTLAAATGASTRELMARMGHASPRAALIYQHATADRDAAIAAALSDLVAGRGNAPGRVVPLKQAMS